MAEQFQRLFLRWFILFAAGVYLTAATGCYQGKDIPHPANPVFQRGFSYVPFTHDVLLGEESEENLDKMLDTGADWVSLVPIWYQDDRYSTTIYPKAYDTPSDESILYTIRYLHERDIKVMLKPYVDSNDGAWRANFEPRYWPDWFKDYREFIWYYAEIAEEENVELFCVGCEYISSDSSKNTEWEMTISGIRERYSGDLTYAANWSDYREVSFWDEMDYIGIDAYFPLSGNEDAELPELLDGWNRELDEIEDWREEYGLTDKEVIFTEVGYRSTVASWVSPGAVADFDVSIKDQKTGFISMFLTVPARPWVRGIFIWWWDNPSSADWGGGRYDDGYTPKGKPAEKVISRFFKSSG